MKKKYKPRLVIELTLQCNLHMYFFLVLMNIISWENGLQKIVHIQKNLFESIVSRLEVVIGVTQV